MKDGHGRERDFVKLLRKQGWFAMRAPGSLGVDVIALLGGKIRFYEVKANEGSPYKSFVPEEREKLQIEAQRAGAEAILCHWPSNKQPRLISSADWPPS